MIYEFLYIIPSRFSDSEIDGIVKQVGGVFEKHGAKVEKTEVVGKLKLAYPVKKDRFGTYVLTYVEAEGDTIKKIDLDLRLADEVLRHVIVKREAGIPKEAFRMEAYEAPITAEGKRIHKKAKVEVAKPIITPVAENVSMEEIDKKLDSILDEGDIGEDLGGV